jgi:iron complex outermembrane receptor protein
LGDLGYAPADLAGTTDYYGLYAVDALDLFPGLTLTVGARLNVAYNATRDRSGNFPELTGSHDYTHLNPLAGLSYKIGGGVNLFGGYSQANRAPTPLELDCANASVPCLLEDSLVSDPPLKQVVAESFEAGLRGAKPLWNGAFSWSASVYRTASHNDIIALGSVIQGRGYYANVPDTRRQGLDLSARFKADGWSAYASYSWLEATYQFTGALSSPNNPMADANGDVTVMPGDHIPVNPANIVKLGGDVDVLDGLSVGGDLGVTGSQFYDGDYANQNQKLPAYWLVNLRASYTLTERWSLYGLVNNVFNRHDASYGTHFDPSNTSPLFSSPLTDVRSVTLLQPVSFELGLRMNF